MKLATKSNLQADVYQALDRDYINLQIKGGTRTANTSRNIAIPLAVRRGARGVPGAQRPRNLQNAFVKDLGNGLVLFQRKASGGRSKARLRTMYALRELVRNKPIFRFYLEGERTARAQFPLLFAKALRQALATAR